MRGPGGRIHDNFFKAMDDCLKAYQRDTVFANNVVWHQHVGRVIMLNWGNLGENRDDLDSTVQILNTSIIHDHLAYVSPDPPDTSLPLGFGLQTSMIYYSSLLTAIHSPHNVLGTSSS